MGKRGEDRARYGSILATANASVTHLFFTHVKVDGILNPGNGL